MGDGDGACVCDGDGACDGKNIITKNNIEVECDYLATVENEMFDAVKKLSLLVSDDTIDVIIERVDQSRVRKNKMYTAAADMFDHIETNAEYKSKMDIAIIRSINDEQESIKKFYDEQVRLKRDGDHGYIDHRYIDHSDSDHDDTDIIWFDESASDSSTSVCSSDCEI